MHQPWKVTECNFQPLLRTYFPHHCTNNVSIGAKVWSYTKSDVHSATNEDTSHFVFYIRGKWPMVFFFISIFWLMNTKCCRQKSNETPIKCCLAVEWGKSMIFGNDRMVQVRNLTRIYLLTWRYEFHSMRRQSVAIRVNYANNKKYIHFGI